MSGYSCESVLGVLGSHKLELFEMKGVFCVRMSVVRKLYVAQKVLKVLFVFLVLVTTIVYGVHERKGKKIQNKFLCEVSSREEKGRRCIFHTFSSYCEIYPNCYRCTWKVILLGELDFVAHSGSLIYIFSWPMHFFKIFFVPYIFE